MSRTPASIHATEPVGFVPVHPKDHGLMRSPTSTAANAAALRAVLLHLTATTFDLSDDETLWAGFAMDSILSPLLTVCPHTVPFAVRQEMMDGTYSRLLELRSKAHLVRGRAAFDATVAQPTLTEWVDTLIGPVEASYELKASTVTHMRAQMSDLLTDLGVGAAVNPRGAAYLPSDLRSRLFADRSRRSA